MAWVGGAGYQVRVSFQDSRNAMNECEIKSLSAGIDIDALGEYRIAIGKNTQEIVKELQPFKLQQKVVLSRLQRYKQKIHKVPKKGD